MGRKPTIKTCADPSCPLTFTGRGLYCDGHKAGRDKPGSELRRERNRKAQQERRRKEWDRRFALGGSPTTGVSSPLHQSVASPQVRGLQVAGQNGQVRRGPDPISIAEPGTGTASDVIDDFMAAWGCDMRDVQQ